MRFAVVGLCAIALATGGTGRREIAAHGVRVAVPPGWHRVQPSVERVDPRTLLVVGTTGVAPRASACQIAAYGIPPRGAAVVIVGWRTATSGGGRLEPGRAPLRKLTAVRRPSFECFKGRGAAAQLVLAGKAYQVNVLVGNRASPRRVKEALSVGRSFGRAR
jgi:hypothetical protein